ncbi:hypothetical protein [Sphingobium sp. AntQ-1]|uniref:hypothetical protein n=1 Tax=Sphingobium sp. AntQ-1 TaxID=2930091 RepID=UPI00234F3C0F|nr:hypothetical protein [Sphingobium sp. AntQ-1]
MIEIELSPSAANSICQARFTAHRQQRFPFLQMGVELRKPRERRYAIFRRQFS